jgi:predicted PurR-regulated permease PerM
MQRAGQERPEPLLPTLDEGTHTAVSGPRPALRAYKLPESCFAIEEGIISIRDSVGDIHPSVAWPLKGLFFLGLILFLQLAQPILAPMVIAIVLAFVLSPAVRMLRRIGIPEVVSAALIVGALIAAVAVALTLLSGPAAQWWQQAPEAAGRVLERLDRVRSSIPALRAPASPGVSGEVARLPGPSEGSRAVPATGAETQGEEKPPPDPVREKIASESLTFTGALLKEILAAGVAVAATIILLFFLLASEHWMLARTVAAVPRRRMRALLLAKVRRAEREIGRFVVSLGLINIGVAIATTLAMMFVGLPNAMLWGTLAAVLNFIPYIGPMIVIALLLLAGTVTFDTPAATLAPAVAFMLVNFVENNFVTPWFVGRRLTLSALAVFVSVLFWGWLWGIPGALIAVPILIAVRSACKYDRRFRLLRAYLEGDNWQPISLRSLVRIRRRRGTPGQ